MKKFYQSGSGRSTPELSDEDNAAADRGRVNPAFSGSLETIDMRLGWHPPGLEVITEEETSDTESTVSTMMQPPYDIYNPPLPYLEQEREKYVQYMLDNVQSGDDMCTDPGCPYNRWLYSGSGYPGGDYLQEWEQDRTRRHFDRLEEIVMSPHKLGIGPAAGLTSHTGTGTPAGSLNSYPIVTYPKQSRVRPLSPVRASKINILCCFGRRNKSRDRSEMSLQDRSSSVPSSLQPPPYSLNPIPPPDPRTSSRATTVNSCSTCSTSSKSMCSCCNDDLPDDPTAPHAFTVDAGRGKAGKKKRSGCAAYIPRCNVACCASLTFMTLCVIGLTVVLLYLRFATSVMSEGMAEV